MRQQAGIPSPTPLAGGVLPFSASLSKRPKPGIARFSNGGYARHLYPSLLKNKTVRLYP
jgi:hypothetical protein